MIPFRISFRAGVPVFEQIVYASKKAMIAGQLRPGDSYPSVRVLSKELKINPNTAHKAVSQLVSEGLLEIRPGIGAVVAEIPDSTKSQRADLLDRETEELVVEGKRLGISLEEMVTNVTAHWRRLGGNSTEGNDGGRKKS